MLNNKLILLKQKLILFKTLIFKIFYLNKMTTAEAKVITNEKPAEKEGYKISLAKKPKPNAQGVQEFYYKYTKIFSKE